MNEKPIFVKKVCEFLSGKKGKVVLTTFVILLAFAYFVPLSASVPPVKKIRIGVIAPWGDIEDYYGYEEYARDLYKQILEPDINAYLAKLPRTRFSPVTEVEFLIESAGPDGDPAVHLDMVEKFHKQGVNMLISGHYSYLAAASLDYINTHDMIMISPTSTGVYLSIPDDNLFRLVPDDQGQGQALAAILEHKGITRLVIIQQDDAWASGIANVLDAIYPCEKVYITYPVDSPNYPDIVDVAENALLENAGEGVLLLSVNAAEILKAADSHTKLLGVDWFGTDATALNGLINEDPIALAIAAQVNLYSSMVSLTPETKGSSKFQSMKTQYESLFPYDKLSLYTASEIDAGWLLTLSFLESQNNVLPTTDGSEIVKILPDVASRYYGYGGWCELNAAGDRMPGNYEIWGYNLLGNVLHGEYGTVTDTLTWVP